MKSSQQIRKEIQFSKEEVLSALQEQYNIKFSKNDKNLYFHCNDNYELTVCWREENE